MPEMKKAINKISGASRYEEKKSRSDDFVKKLVDVTQGRVNAQKIATQVIEF